jgi:hypothetical protein
MPRKIDVSQMTPDEIVAYDEKVKQQNRESKSIITTLLKPIPNDMKHGYNNAGKQAIDNTIRGWQLESNN